MKIRHEDWGEVDKVEPFEDRGRGHGWKRNYRGCLETYYHGLGWSEVKEPRYVDVTGECNVILNGDAIVGCGGPLVSLPCGYRFKKPEWFDLPENLLHDIHSMTVKGFIEYIQRFKKPCLIVEKEGE